MILYMSHPGHHLMPNLLQMSPPEVTLLWDLIKGKSQHTCCWFSPILRLVKSLNRGRLSAPPPRRCSLVRTGRPASSQRVTQQRRGEKGVDKRGRRCVDAHASRKKASWETGRRERAEPEAL